MNCYNGERFLKQSLNSVINQDYQNWELIFFDNSSTDKSAEIFKSYLDRRFHYYNSNKPSLRDEKRSENMSMLFVLRIENYNGKYLVASLIKGYGRDLIIRFYHPIFKEYVKISDENDANEFLSSLLLEKKFVNELSPFKSL